MISSLYREGIVTTAVSGVRPASLPRPAVVRARLVRLVIGINPASRRSLRSGAMITIPTAAKPGSNRWLILSGAL